MSGLVGNSRRHVLSCRGSYVLFESSKTKQKNKNLCGLHKNGNIMLNIVDISNYRDFPTFSQMGPGGP